EGEHALVLRVVAHLAPARVIAILLAGARVAADGLDVAMRRRADPDVAPRRRDRQRADAREGGPIAHPTALGIDVHEAAADVAASQAGAAFDDVREPRRLRRLDGVRNDAATRGARHDIEGQRKQRAVVPSGDGAVDYQWTD